MQFKKYIKGDMSKQEFEEISEQLIQAKFDREKKNDWEQKLKNDYGVEKNTKKKWRFYNLSIAASVLLLIASSIYFITSKTEKNEDIVNNYIENLSIISEQTIAFRGNTLIDDKIEAAAINYRNKNFKESIFILESVITENDSVETPYLYYDLALCYLQKPKPEPKKAISLLLKAKSLNGPKQEIDWILALAYLKNKEKDKAIKQLLKIVNEGTYKVNEAQDLLNSIKS